MFREHRIVSECESGGYVYARTDPPHPKANSKGLYLSHRIIVENNLGRYLEKSEIVHHRNGNKKDNSFSNLGVMHNSVHTSLHWEGRRIQDIKCVCKFCGKTFELEPWAYRLRTNRNKEGRLFCSQSCGAKYQHNEYRGVS